MCSSLMSSSPAVAGNPTALAWGLPAPLVLHVRLHLLLDARATEARKLEAVRGKPWCGAGAGRDMALTSSPQPSDLRLSSGLPSWERDGRASGQSRGVDCASDIPAA